MFFLKMKISNISNKGGDTETGRYLILIHHQVFGVKYYSRGRLKISHTVY